MELEKSSPSKLALVKARAGLALLVAGGLALTQAGCREGQPDAGDPSSASGGGTVMAFVMDGAAAPGMAGADDQRVQGRFLGNFIVSVYSPVGVWVDLGRRAEMTVPLGNGAPSALLEGLDIPPGTYTRVRVLLCHSSADIDPGSWVAGEEVEEDSPVFLTETGDIFIIRDVEPFQVTPSRPVHLDIDLNSSGWLTREVLEDGRANIPIFEDQVKVRVRGSGTR
jgi:hypothetical protein